MSETVKRITELQLCGSDSRAQSYNEGLKAAIHILESCEQPQLNENQQIVLDWLKNYASRDSVRPVDTVGIFWQERNLRWQLQKWRMNSNSREQAQVLQAFSQWVLEQEEE